MSYRYTEKEKARGISRRTYFRDRRRRLKGTKTVEGLYGPAENGTVSSVGETSFMRLMKDAKWVGRPYDGECYLGKVDVKTSRPINGTRGKKWKFHLARQRGIVDSFILFCLDDLSNIVKILVVPDAELTVNDISMGLGSNSKYNKYSINL